MKRGSAGLSAALSLFCSVWAFGAGLCNESIQKQVSEQNQISAPAPWNTDQLGDAKSPQDPRILNADDINVHADQCRAVLGPIPQIDCLEGDLVPVTRQGKPVTFRDGFFYEDGEKRDWKSVPSCDRPALVSGTGRGCQPGTRLGVIRRGSVDWVYSCHSDQNPKNIDDPEYEGISLIGANRDTGETCFFVRIKVDKVHYTIELADGHHIPLPGGSDPQDLAGRKRAGEFWTSPVADIPPAGQCTACHGNNKPMILTPALNQQRVGGGEWDTVPETPLDRRVQPQWGYRVIGSAQNRVWAKPKLIYPKLPDGREDHTCTRCHLLSDQRPMEKFIRESVHLPMVPHGIPHPAEVSRQAWMPPDSWDAPSDSDLLSYRAAAERFTNAIANPAGRFREREMLSPCPAPAAVDPAGVRVSKINKNGLLEWVYRNDYGGVAERDDVRFKVSVVGSDGLDCTFENIAPVALGDGHWRFQHPASPAVSYRYSLTPYRYCFDGQAYQTGPSIEIKDR